jgi:hypothetical protein
MAKDEPKIIDIKNLDYEMMWLECSDYFNKNCQQDPLFENYRDLNPMLYEQFVGVVLDNRIVSFGAVDRKPNCWGIGVVRALTRFWIHPEYRTKGLTKWTSDSIKYSPAVLKPQLANLKNRSDVRAVIITREGNYRRSFQEIVRLANTVALHKFEIMPGMYNVCRPEAEDCFQMVAVSSFCDVSPEEIFKQQRLKGYFKSSL